MNQTDNCELCPIPSSVNALKLDKFWTVNNSIDSTDRPWIVIQSVRHVENIGDLTKEEANSLGHHLKTLSKHLSKLKNVHKVHVYQINEGSPGHVHFHLTVSTAKDKKEYGTLLGKPMPNSLESNPKSKWIPGRSKKDHLEPSFLVRSIVRLCNFIKRFNVIYPTIQKILKKKGIDTGYAAEIYVIGSLVTFMALLVFLNHSNSLLLRLALVLGVLRIIDIWSTQLSIILDRGARMLKSFERTFVLAAINLLEVSFISAIWLKEAEPISTLQAISQGFRLATNRSTIETTTFAKLAIEVSIAATTLLLLVVVISVILGKIASERFDEVNTE